MKKIGVVPGVRLNKDLNWYVGEYFFTDTYTSRVTEAGGLPIGIVSSHGVLREEVLELCDAFLLCGGQRILPYHLQVVDHVVRTGKPLLGVCLGMQAIHSYFAAAQQKRERGFDGSVLEMYEQMKKERYYFVEPVADRNSVNPTDYTMENIRTIRVLPGTRLAEILPAEGQAAMRHSYRITKPAADVTVSALDEDGETIVGIERGENILAVQFHPELADEYAALFGFLTQ